jgi:Ca-activated chloride channel homolog
MRHIISTCISMLLSISLYAQAETCSELAGVLCGRAADPEEGRCIELFLPLKKTTVEMDVTAGQISATVTQTFENDSPYPLEAAYIFPLPARASIIDMRLQVGERVIRSIVQERAEAKKTYEAAKAEGKKTALLEQERPNIFTTSLANFLPGETLSVSFSYMEPLEYENGSYNINFPMVVGQRYIPWKLSASGNSTAVVETEVEDAARLNPPLLHPNIDPGHRLSIAAELRGLPIAALESSTHAITVDEVDPQTTRVTLRDGVCIPDSDFNLRVALQPSEQPRMSFVQSRRKDDSYGLLTIFPPARASARTQIDLPREVIFLIDTSGSMSGASIGQAQAGLRECLSMLTPRDSFNIVRFASEYSSFAPESRPATPAKIRAALGYADSLGADGGTEMQPALEHCLDMPASEDRMRIIVFLTDGCVGNEDSLLRLLNRKLGATRLFTFAIGSAPNEYLTRKMAEIGRGQFRFIHSHEEIDRVMSDFFKTIASPVFTDIRVDWLDQDGTPRRINAFPEICPDIFYERPVQIVVESETGFSGSIALRGRLGDDEVADELSIGAADGDPHPAIEKLYGRARIDALMFEMIRAGSTHERDVLRAQITAVALEHQLVSKFTSRVAVEERVEVTPRGELKSVTVPTPLPKGWNPAAFGATSTQDLLLLALGLAGLALGGVLAAINHGRAEVR